MPVLVEDAAQTVTSSDVEPGKVVSIGDRCRHGRNGRAFAMPWCGRCPCRTVRARAGRGASAADSRARSGPAVRAGTSAPTPPFAVDVAEVASNQAHARRSFVREAGDVSGDRLTGYRRRGAMRSPY